MKQTISILLAGTIAITACNPTVHNDSDAAMKAQQFTIDSMKQEIAKKHIVDSMNQLSAAKAETPAAAVAERPVRTKYRTRTVYVNQGSSAASAGGSTVNSYSGYSQEPPRKKGWSAKAKGAAIGAGVGALSGALIGKEKGKGAIIGGVLGAGAGLGTGAIIDARKKKKELQEQNR